MSDVGAPQKLPGRQWHKRLWGALVHNASQYTAILVLRRILGVSITIPAAHLFGAAFYGQLVLISNIVFIVSTAATFGLNVVAFRGAGTDDQRMVDAVGRLLCVVIPASGVLLATLVCALQLSVFNMPYAWLGIALLTGTFTPSSAAYLFAILRSTNRSGIFVKVNILMLTLNFALKAALVFVFHFGVIAWLAADLLAALTGWVMALRLYRPRRSSWSTMRMALVDGAPMIPHLLLHWIVSAVDRFFIERYCGIAAVGVYSAAYQIPEFVGSTLGETNAAFMPRYVSSNAQIRLQEVARTQIKLAGTLVVTAAFVAPAVTLHLFPNEFASGVVMIPALAVAYLGYGVYLIAANLITLTHSTTRRMWTVSGVAGSVNIAVNVALIPQIGLWGATLATVAAYFVMCLQGIRRSKKVLAQLSWMVLFREGRVAWTLVGCIAAQVLWLWVMASH